MSSATNPLGFPATQDNCGNVISNSPGSSTPPVGSGVQSVNGKTGVVVLSTRDLVEELNLFFTNVRARGAISATLPIEYDNMSGIITHVNSPVTPGQFGSAVKVPKITVNEKGHVTAVEEMDITAGAVGPDLAAIEALSTTGILVRVADDTWSLKPILGTAGEVVLTHGDGTSGDPTIKLASIITPGTKGTSLKVPRITVDATGRITSVVEVDIAFPTGSSATLGSLVNVNIAVNTAAAVGDMLMWNGTEWVYMPPTKMTSSLNSATVITSPWLEGTGEGVSFLVHFVRVNSAYTNNSVVHYSFMFYAKISDLGMLTNGTPLLDSPVFQIPVGFRPMQTTTVNCGHMLKGAQFGDLVLTGFVGTQKIDILSLTMARTGAVNVLGYKQSGATLVTLGGDDHVIITACGSYRSE